MKKILLFLLGLFFVSIQTFADTRATALLLHNGQGKSFDADQLQLAVNEAVAGDTIYLSEGAFLLTGDTLTIDKDVCIIGAGADVCKIGGNVYVAIDGNPTLTRHLLDAVKVTGALDIKKDVKGVSLRKCWIGKWLQGNACEVRDLKIDRCFLNQFGCQANKDIPEIKSATVSNSIILVLGKKSSITKPYKEGYDINFLNCNIACITFNCSWAATFTNCIIGASYGNTNPGSIINNTFINTLLNNNSGSIAIEGVYRQYNIANAISQGNIMHNCYNKGFTLKTDQYLNDFPTFIITKEVLLTEGFFGTDGTIIGADGGHTPYSLEPEGISVKKGILRVDPETRQLNVTLKVASK